MEDKKDILETNGAETVYLNPQNCEFYNNKNGFLALTLDGKVYKRVKLTRALPITNPDIFVCVCDNDNKEIGIIKNLNEFAPEIRRLLDRELDGRYYCPVVSDVKSVKEKMGYFYFDVFIGEHKKSFAIKDITKNIKQLDDKRIMFTDVDGNRFIVPDIMSINKKSRRRIEPFLY